MSNARDHPFEVGGRYCNQIGDYEVLSLDDEKMTVRYDDGLERSHKIEIQARIWQRRLDQASPPAPSKKRSRARGESQPIQPVIDLLRAVLTTKFTAPYPEDITDQVCLAIEANPVWLQRYRYLIEHYSSRGKDGKLAVNTAIGFHTKRLTGMVKIGESKKPRSSLIQSYSRLSHEDTLDSS
jgi:hypothetical protein